MYIYIIYTWYSTATKGFAFGKGGPNCRPSVFCTFL